MAQDEAWLAELVIEGADADRAAEELMDPTVVDGRIDTDDRRYREPVTLTIIATIIAMSAGGVDIAAHISDWYAKWRRPPAHIEKVVLILPDGRRVVLEDVSPEKLRELLKN